MGELVKFVPHAVAVRPPSPPLADAPALTFDFAHLCRLLLSRRWLIIAFIVLCLLAATCYLLQAPKIYESRASLEVEEEAPRVVNIQEINTQDYRSPEVLKTIEQTLLSDTLLLRVIKANGLDNDPVFAPPKPDGSAYLDIELADRFKKKLTVALRRGTRLIDISVEDTDPRRAQQLTASVVKEFVDQNFEQKFSVAKAANDFLLQEADRLKAKLHKSEEAVQKYREDNFAVSLEDKQNIIVEKLKELNLKVTQAKAERLKLEPDALAIQQGRAKTPEDLLTLASVNSVPVVVDLRRQLAEKQSKYKMDGQMNGLKQTLNRALLNAGTSVVKSYEAAKATEAKLSAALKDQEQAALDLNKIAIPYNVLVRELESDRALYESVLTRMKETGVTKGINDSNIRVIESPLVASAPVKPRKLKILALALLAGLVVGSGVVIILDMTDSSIRSIDQAERISGLPVLTSIPESRRKHLDKEPVLIAGPASHEAEAFRSLRTALSFCGQDEDLKTILFTSANSAEGKTYCSLNYAVALAQMGFRTLLIDADLRRTHLSRLVLADPKAPGLTDCLTRCASIVDCSTPTGIENLSILGAGERASKPTEVLGSGEFAHVIKEAALHFDRIVLDSAPVNPVSDTRLIAKEIQAVCLVVRAGKTPQRAVARACHLLAQAVNTSGGMILNRMARRSSDCYYSSYYAGGYAHAGVYGQLGDSRREA